MGEWDRRQPLVISLPFSSPALYRPPPVVLVEVAGPGARVALEPGDLGQGRGGSPMAKYWGMYREKRKGGGCRPMGSQISASLSDLSGVVDQGTDGLQTGCAQGRASVRR